jgi:hypothetical protein
MNFTAEEWKLIFAAMSYVPDEWLESSVFRALCLKVRHVRDEQERHESRQAKLFTVWPDVEGEPESWSRETQNAVCRMVYNAPEDKSGVQGEKFRQLMPHLIKLDDYWDESE